MRHLNLDKEQLELLKCANQTILDFLIRVELNEDKEKILNNMLNQLIVKNLRNIISNNTNKN